MPQIIEVDVSQANAVEGIAIALAADGKHTGIIYKWEESHKFLHLAFHRRLQNETVPANYILVIPDLEPEDEDNLVAISEAVWVANLNGRILYGFGSPEDAFPDINYLSSGIAFGLTCASFVLAVFHRAMLPLVEYETWPSHRQNDATWQSEILTTLETYIDRKHSNDAEHLAKVKQMTPAVRFRPIEVAAAGLQPQATKFSCIGTLILVLCHQTKISLSDFDW